MAENKGIVSLKGDDIFTDSKVLSECTGYEHNSITRILRRHSNDFKEFGKFRFMDLVSKNPQGGRPEKIYLLNEQQATLLMTYLENTKPVRGFKKKLVSEFYRMRMALMQRQSTGWLETRKNGKMIRRLETDAIAELIEYANEQGSTHSHMLYMSYSKLVNAAAGIKGEERDKASVQTLTQLAFFEDVIMGTIREEIAKGTPYRDIYYICKAKIEQITGLAYLPELRLLIN